MPERLLAMARTKQQEARNARRWETSSISTTLEIGNRGQTLGRVGVKHERRQPLFDDNDPAAAGALTNITANISKIL